MKPPVFVAPTRCVFDSDVVVGLLAPDDAHHGAAVRLLAQLRQADCELLISAVNYGEVMTRPSEDPARLARVIDALRASGLQVMPVDHVIAVVAAGHRLEGVSLADGFALSLAAEQRAAIATFDKRVRRTADDHGIQVLPA